MVLFAVAIDRKSDSSELSFHLWHGLNKKAATIDLSIDSSGHVLRPIAQLDWKAKIGISLTGGYNAGFPFDCTVLIIIPVDDKLKPFACGIPKDDVFRVTKDPLLAQKFEFLVFSGMESLQDGLYLVTGASLSVLCPIHLMDRTLSIAGSNPAALV